MLESLSDLMRAQPNVGRHLLDEVPAGLGLVDAGGRLKACNAELKRILEGCTEQLDTLALRPLFAQEGARNVRTPLARALAGETVQAEDYELGREGQLPLWVRVSAAPASQPSGGAWLLMVDVGERRNLEAMREQVLGVVAHDLRNPMSAMRMTLAMLSKGAEMPTERRLSLAERLTGTLGRMEALVNTLAEYARADAGVDLRLTRGPANLGLLYDKVAPDLDVIYPNRTIEVQRLGDLEGVWDGPRLERVLAHLVGNALKHGRDDAPVQLTLDGTAGDRVRITVANQGTPIPAELLPLVYEPFTTGAFDKHGRRRAIGLGLFVVRHLVQAHGGTIQLTSDAAKGTVVTVDLPRALQGQPSQASQVSQVSIEGR